MFKIGDQVTWSSQAGGFTAIKTGEVVGVVPAGVYISAANMRGATIAPVDAALTKRFDGGKRTHESYLVKLRPGLTEKSTPVLYWPRVNSLRAL